MGEVKNLVAYLTKALSHEIKAKIGNGKRSRMRIKEFGQNHQNNEQSKDNEEDVIGINGYQVFRGNCFN